MPSCQPRRRRLRSCRVVEYRSWTRTCRVSLGGGACSLKLRGETLVRPVSRWTVCVFVQTTVLYCAPVCGPRPGSDSLTGPLSHNDSRDRRKLIEDARVKRDSANSHRKRHYLHSRHSAPLHRSTVYSTRYRAPTACNLHPSARHTRHRNAMGRWLRTRPTCRCTPNAFCISPRERAARIAPRSTPLHSCCPTRTAAHSSRAGRRPSHPRRRPTEEPPRAATAPSDAVSPRARARGAATTTLLNIASRPARRLLSARTSLRRHTASATAHRARPPPSSVPAEAGDASPASSMRTESTKQMLVVRMRACARARATPRRGRARTCR